MNFKTTLPLLAGLLSSMPALAVTFDFTTLAPDVFYSCTGGDRCSNSGNVGAGGAFTFEGGAIDITSATGSYDVNDVWRTATVVQDKNGSNTSVPWVGLGVYNADIGQAFVSSDDNITTNEKLTIVFNQTVTLTGLSLRAEGHGLFANDSEKTFLLNGDQQFLRGSLLGLNATGTTFTFEFGGRSADQYYLSGMTVVAVPEPETYALMLAGLAAVGFMARRRRQA